MKKHFFVLLFLLPALSGLRAQFPFGETALTDGAITVSIITTTLRKEEGKIVHKTIQKCIVSSKLLLKLLSSSVEDYKAGARKESLSGKKIDEMLQGVIAGNNCTKTLDKGQLVFPGPLPLHTVTCSTTREEYSLDPCNQGDDRKLIMTETCSAGGALPRGYCDIAIYREGLAGDGFRLSFDVQNPPKKLGGGGVNGSGKLFAYDDIESKCKWKDAECGGSASNSNCLQFVNSTEGLKRMARAFYVKEEIQGQSSYRSEMHYLTIDTAQFFAYLQNTKIPKTFGFAPGSYHRTVTTDGQVTDEVIEDCSATLTLGVVDRELEISGKDDETYHNWIPIPAGEKDYEPCYAKAKIKTSDKVKEDTLYFSLEEVSNYKGICTNFPSEKEAGITSDMVFSATQDDPNIEFVDTFHVKTKKPVTEAYATIESKDYAARGKLVVRTATGLKGVGKYDNKKFLAIPEDDNDNKVADAWEKQVHLYEKNLPAKDDNDENPKKQRENGDGLTLFEEYRGFNTIEDISADGSNLLRNGNHVRTDPQYKDVFLLDESQKFTKYYKPNNAGKLNWHLVDKTMMEVETSIIAQVKSFSNPNEKAYLDYLGILSKEASSTAHRQINFNSPPQFRNNAQFGLYLLKLQAMPAMVAGVACFPTNTAPSKSIRFCSFIAVSDESKFFSDIASVLMKMDAAMGKPQTSADQKNEIARLQYEATIIHEIGHAIGIEHHMNGDIRYKDSNGNEIALNRANAWVEGKNSYEALIRGGVKSCAMKYTFQGMMKEFWSSQIYNSQTEYCTKDQTYVDDYFQQRKSDNCFGQIKIKCDK